MFHRRTHQPCSLQLGRQLQITGAKPAVGFMWLAEQMCCSSTHLALTRSSKLFGLQNASVARRLRNRSAKACHTNGEFKRSSNKNYTNKVRAYQSSSPVRWPSPRPTSDSATHREAGKKFASISAHVAKHSSSLLYPTIVAVLVSAEPAALNAVEQTWPSRFHEP